jgi:hypothetical protein
MAENDGAKKAAKQKRRAPVYAVFASLPPDPRSGERSWVRVETEPNLTVQESRNLVEVMAKQDRVGSQYLICRVLDVREIWERPAERTLGTLNPATAVDNVGIGAS